MKRYIGKRLLHLLVVILGVTFLTFLIAQAAPSDPAEMSYISRGIAPTQEQLALTREEMGLNDPLIVQYWNWLVKLLHGDLGKSYNNGNGIWQEMTRKLPQTAKLAGSTLFVVILISFPLGVFTAVHQNQWLDYVVRFTSFFGISMPGFWLGLVTMYVFGVVLRIFPIVGKQDLRSMVMPLITLTVPMICSYIRQIRVAIMEELSNDYITGMRSRGVSEKRILYRHVLPNAMPPIITLLGLSIGGLLGGAAIVETIFGWQGIGDMVVSAIRVRDYPVIQAYVLWMAIIYVVTNLLVDIAQYVMDPELRKSSKLGG